MIAQVVASAVIAAMMNLTSVYDGVFALGDGKQKTQGHLRVTQTATNPGSRHLDVWLTRGGSQTVEGYDVDMTKLLHLIVISDDFETFMHVHPMLGSDGHFSIDAGFPKPGYYHVYADCDPTGIGKQVFRFDVPLGGAPDPARDVRATGPSVRAGKYVVALATTQLRAGSETAVAVHITANGRPATDLHPFLGALAHAVFINAEDLSYAHVHPMPLTGGDMPAMGGMSDMSGMTGMGGMTGMKMPALSDSATSSPDMLLHVRVAKAGTYKLWLQFRGAGGLNVAPFVLTAT